MTPTIKAHKLCDSQPTPSFALLSVHEKIEPMIPGYAHDAFDANLPTSDAKALSLFLIHSFASLSSPLLSGFVEPPTEGNNASQRKPITISNADNMKTIMIPCSRNNVCIFSRNMVSLSRTFSLVLVT